MIKISCVYKIEVGEEVYFGQTQNYLNRVYRHLNQLVTNSHYNTRLQGAYNMTKSFSTHILFESKNLEMLQSIEKDYIDKNPGCCNNKTKRSLGNCGLEEHNLDGQEDKRVFQWIHKNGDMEELTRKDMRNKYKLDRKQLQKVINGKAKTIKGWQPVKVL